MNRTTDLVAHLPERVAQVQHTIQATARACGRDPSTIRLIAVSKTFGPEYIHAAYRCGLREFGENRVQEARKKIPWCPPDLVWHMVGYLQTNKVAWAVRLFSVLHSLDRATLVPILEKRCQQYQRTLDVLIEIKLAPEPTKTGCPEHAVLELAGHVLRAQHLRLRGLMTMPPYDPDPERARPYYRKLAEWGRVLQEWCAEQGHPLERVELSMGMSHDYPVAIEEGATMVRIGTAIFGPRPEP